MASVENFRQLLKPLIFYSKVLGVEMWTAPGKFLPASYYLSTQMAIYLISTITTVIKYRNDPLHLMKVLVTLGTAVQLYIKFFVGHFKANEVKQFTETVEHDILEKYQKGTKEEVAMLDRTGRYLWIIFRITSVICFIAGAAFALYPIFAYYTTGNVLPLLLYELPYYDFSTTAGYAVNMLFQLNLLVNGVLGVMLADIAYLIFAMYAMVVADILIVHLGELEAMLNDPLKDDTKRSEVREKWVQCMYDHQQSTSFLNIIEDIFGLQCLAQVVMGVFTICDCMLLVALIDEMYHKIISMPWYKLPVKEQKEFCFLVSRQQRPMMLTAFGFHPMNFEAYMSVLKGLYQFFVMVMQYVG
ncbi:odorant receptor 30a-like [Anopheles funestus]|uniref:odorant receptor 30a-like n=1 Tax=Anopheles funestus TaxID=62324 RepID=UPI0020C726AA|nr:odorant receptor 30a-like [Anopheles funestus]